MIHPGETPSNGSEPPKPAHAADTLYFGVLRPGSTLMRIFPSRVVPLDHPRPQIIKIGPRFVKCVLIPYTKLLHEHQLGLLEWLKEHTPDRLEFTKERIDATGFLAVSEKHFSGIVGAKAKDPAP